MGNQLSNYRLLRLAIVASAAVCIGAVAVLVTPTRPAHAATSGNIDGLEAGMQIKRAWWGGLSENVTQRYGCTSLGPPYEDPPPSICNTPPNNQGWHQGIDIGVSSGTSITSQVAGTVVDSQTSCLDSGCGLGRLAIKTGTGNIIYLLHGSSTVGVNAPVNVGDQIYTTGSNGAATGPHLHFEVHTSVYGLSSLSANPGPGDDINPEGWLAIGAAGRASGSTFQSAEIRLVFPPNAFTHLSSGGMATSITSRLYRGRVGSGVISACLPPPSEQRSLLAHCRWVMAIRTCLARECGRS